MHWIAQNTETDSRSPEPSIVSPTKRQSLSAAQQGAASDTDGTHAAGNQADSATHASHVHPAAARGHGNVGYARAAPPASSRVAAAAGAAVAAPVGSVAAQSASVAASDSTALLACAGTAADGGIAAPAPAGTAAAQLTDHQGDHASGSSASQQADAAGCAHRASIALRSLSLTADAGTAPAHAAPDHAALLSGNEEQQADAQVNTAAAEPAPALTPASAALAAAAATQQLPDGAAAANSYAQQQAPFGFSDLVGRTVAELEQMFECAPTMPAHLLHPQLKSLGSGAQSRVRSCFDSRAARLWLLLVGNYVWVAQNRHVNRQHWTAEPNMAVHLGFRRFC